MLRKLLCLLLITSPSLATPSFSVTISGYNAKGSTGLQLQSAQATLMPTALPTPGMGTLHQLGTGTTSDEYYSYVGANTTSDVVTISPGLVTSKYTSGSYIYQVWTPVNTPTVTNTPTSTATPTNTPTQTPTPTSTPIPKFTAIVANGTPVNVTLTGTNTGNFYNLQIINGGVIAPTPGWISYKANAGSVSICVSGGVYPVTLSGQVIQ